ncbi:MAG: hypothetical protein WB245_10065 [Acidimicrobiia bacterium]
MSPRIAVAASIMVLLAACGGASNVSQEGADATPAVDTGDDNGSGGGGDVLATMQVAGDKWEMTNVACIAGVDSLDFVASDGMIGVSGDVTMTVKVIGDWSGDSGGQIESIDISLVEGELFNPDRAWQATLDVGAASVTVNGTRVHGEGLFDDLLTQGDVEAEQGSFDGECPEDLVEPEVVETTIPDYPVDGMVTVGGETFTFTYEAPGGMCGQDAGDGKFASRGFLVDDPTRQLVFTYGLPEATPDASPVLQIVIYAQDGSQLWYSSIGYGFDVGTVDNLTREGNTVTATGTLQKSGSSPEEYAEFTAEATCSR